MKTFSNIKRELRTLYKPKGFHKTRPTTAGDRPGTAETLDNRSAIQLAHVSSMPDVGLSGGKDGAKPYGDARSAEVDSQSPPGEHKILSQDAMVGSNNCDTVDKVSTKNEADESVPEKESRLEEDKTRGPQDFHEETDAGTFDNAEPLPNSELQAIRDQEYFLFDYEAPEDYTGGPPRLVCASDGVKEDCIALLMTFDLSTRIQIAIQGQRDFARAETAGIFKRQSLLRLERDVQREITSCKARLAILEEEEGEVEKPQAENEEAQKLNQQMRNLELMLEDVQARRQEVRTDVEVFRAENLRNLQAAVNAYLEEAFIAARLLASAEEEPEPEVEDLDIKQEYQGFCDRLAAFDDNLFEFAVPPLDISRKHLEAEPLSEEEEAKQAILQELYGLKENLDLARAEFDIREVRRDREFKENMEAAENGVATTDESPEAFDLRWVRHNQYLTRELINAEAAYAEKKREVQKAGIPIHFADAGSILDDTVDGGVQGTGYDVSVEQEMVTSKPSPTVRRWLSKVPDTDAGLVSDEARETRGDADEWEAEEVGISDSVSLVAEGKERARIDRWRKACLESKKE